MLKAQVPVYFYSIACMILPPKPYTGQPVVASAKEVSISNRTGRNSSVSSRKNKIALALTDKQGMKFVSSYIRNNNEDLHAVKKRSEGPFTIIDSVLSHYGLPLELKYLAVIESELKPTALSRVGAKGPWQLMPTTAHELGLKVSRRTDDRTSFYMSTRAAAKYLRDLHREFGDWLLVLAAYNGGPVPVDRAIHRAHSRNFWKLQYYLPEESRAHVKKFIATAFYFEGAGKTVKGNVTTTAPAIPPKYMAGSVAVTNVVNKAKVTVESPDEKFSRLMKESAEALRASGDAMKTSGN
jgi:membrane-bound lytic murein transglycosylase D